MTRRALLVGPGEVAVREVELPPPGPDEVRVRIVAAPIDPADLLLVDGRHLARPQYPAVIGIEGAGVVEQAGGGLAVGQLVALPYGGTWSESVVIRADAVVPLPAGFDPEQAAMLCVNPMTALGLLDGVGAGDVVIQNAAASAVGQLVIRLAAQRGIRTLNIVRRAQALAGATWVIAGDDDLAAKVAACTRDPIVRALDAVAGAASGRLLDVLADRGTLVCYGLLGGDTVELPARQLVFRDVSVRGFSRLRWLVTLSPEARAAHYAELIASGHATAIAARYPLDRLADAIAHARAEGRAGKVMLTP